MLKHLSMLMSSLFELLFFCRHFYFLKTQYIFKIFKGLLNNIAAVIPGFLEENKIVKYKFNNVMFKFTGLLKLMCKSLIY